MIYLKDKVRASLEVHIKKKEEINLEDLFTSFDKSIGNKEHLGDYTYIEIDKLSHQLMRIFIYYFAVCTARHSFISNDYFNFINFIQKNGNDAHTIISTNWDMLFEKYLNNKGVKINYCLNEKYYDNENGKRKRIYESSAVNYIKLHGSLNWFRCLNCGSLLIKKYDNYSSFIFDDSIPEKCNVCNSQCNATSVQLHPEIITPTMVKSISGQLFRNLWKAAYDELHAADRVVFIGYSLPTADYELRNLIQRAIRPNSSIDIVLWKTDDPNKFFSKTERNEDLAKLLPHTRYQELLTQNKLNFYYDGFGEYFNRG